jgi:hypothetical protein
MNRMMAPGAAPTKAAGLQGKKPQGSGGPCLWGQQWTQLPVCLSRREKYCHNGGMTFAHHSGKVIRPGSTISILAPGATRQKPSISREEV